MDNVQRHKQITDDMHKTYKDKNADYGNSFALTRNKYNKHFPVIMIRLHDKFTRLETLLLNSQAPKVQESIQDTLLDLANYCIMEVIEMEKEG